MKNPNSTSYYLFSRLGSAVFLLCLLLFIGWAGFYYYFDYTSIDALYMTVITVSTVGFGEVHPLNTEGKIFTSVLIIFSGIIFAYSISTISAYLINVHTLFDFKTNRMQKNISTIKDHIIVCGYGRNGKQAATKLNVYEQKYLVIDKNESTLTALKEREILHIQGDATDDNVLLNAGIERAKYLILTLPSDADNVFITLSARQLNKKLIIISRASDETSVSKLRIAGVDNVIMPDKIGGDHMASLIVSPDLLEFLDNLSSAAEGKMNLKEILLQNLSNIKTIGDLNIQENTGCTVVGYKTKSNDYIINPDKEQVVEKEGRIIVLGRTEQLNKLNQYFNV